MVGPRTIFETSYLRFAYDIIMESLKSRNREKAELSSLKIAIESESAQKENSVLIDKKLLKKALEVTITKKVTGIGNREIIKLLL